MTRHAALALALILSLATLISVAGFLAGRVTRASDGCTTDTECAEMYGGYGDPEPSELAPVEVLI